jgi:hypothetical protein
MNRELALILKLQDQMSKDLKAAMGNVEKETSKTLGAVGSFFGKASDQAQALTKAVQTLAVAGGAGLVYYGKKSVDAYNESVEVATKLEKIILNLNGATMDNVEALKRQARELQKVGVFGDDVVMAAQAQLATFDLTSESIEKVIPGLLDMMAAEKGMNATMQDSKDIAQGLGKAFNGQYDMLVKQGFIITDVQKKMIEFGDEQTRAEAITQILGTTYNGLNQEMRKTFQGQMIAAKNTMGDFMELVGQFITEHLQPMVTKFNEWTDAMGGADGVFNALKTKIQELISFIGGNPYFQLFVEKMREFGEWIMANKETVITFLQGLAIALGGILIVTTIATALTAILSPLNLIIIAVALLYTAWKTNFMGIQDIVYSFTERIKKEWDSFNKNFFESAKASFMMVVYIVKFVVQLITDIITVFILFFTGEWDAMFEAIEAGTSHALGNIKGIFSNAWTAIREGITGIYNYFTGKFGEMWNKAKDIAEKIRHAISSAFDKDKKNSPSIADRLREMTAYASNHLADFAASIPSVSTDVRHSISDNMSDMTNVPTAATGGIVININGGTYLDANSGQILADIIYKNLKAQINV